MLKRLIFLAALFILAGCAYTVKPTEIYGGQVSAPPANPVSVMIATQKIKAYRYSGHPSSFASGAARFDFDMGEALSRTMFTQSSQTFGRVLLSENTPGKVPAVKLIVEPEVTGFDFRHDMGAAMLVGMFATSSVEAEIKLAADVYSPDRSVSFRVTSTGRGSSSAYGFGFSPERNTTEATAFAILDGTRNLISAIAASPEFSRLPK